MAILSLVSYQGDALWTLDILFNLWIKSSIFLGALFILIRSLRQYSAIQQQRIWRLGFGALLVLGVSTYSSLWEWQFHPATTGIQEANITTIDEKIQHLPADAAVSSTLPTPAYRTPNAVRWDLYLQVFWWLGFLFFMGKAFLERALLKWVSRSGLAVKELIDKIDLPPLLSSLQLSTAPQILVSNKVQIPMTFGWLKPTILLPTEVEEWETEKLQQVILHELIHIQRKDYLFHGLSLLVQSIYWFNPLVWKAVADYRIGSEWACDETVILQGTDQFSYAENLVAIAANQHRKMGQVAFSFAKTSDLAGRIKRLLASKNEVKQSRQRLILLGLSLVLGIAMSMNLRSIGEKPFSDSAYRATLLQLQSTSQTQKIQALKQLGTWGKQQTFYSIKSFALDADTEVQKTALWALQQIGCLPAFCLISQQLKQEDLGLQQYAQELLQTYDGNKLYRYINDNIDKPAVQDWMEEHLEQVRQAQQSQLLARHLAKGSPNLQDAIWQVLQSPKHPKALQQLKQLLSE